MMWQRAPHVSGGPPQSFFSHTSHLITPSTSHPMSPASSGSSVHQSPSPTSLPWLDDLPPAAEACPEAGAGLWLLCTMGGASPRRPRRCGRAGGARSPAARVRGSDFGRRRERRHFLPPTPLRCPRRRPRAQEGRAGLLPPARRPIPPSPAQVPHLLSTYEGRRKTVIENHHQNHRGTKNKQFR
jgi:hypothetical protein